MLWKSAPFFYFQAEVFASVFLDLIKSSAKKRDIVQ